MSRFDVFEFKGEKVQLVLDVQADIFSDINSRVVIPLIPRKEAADEEAKKLKPVLRIKNQSYILMTTEISAVPLSMLGKCITNIEHMHRQEIVEAMDFLFQGF